MSQYPARQRGHRNPAAKISIAKMLTAFNREDVGVPFNRQQVAMLTSVLVAMQK
jgi:hypothetical protein